MNGSPLVVNDLNKIPIRYSNGAMIYVGDVAFVHDGFQPQTNLVRREGRHSALLPILSNGSASTLSVVDGVRQLMPKILAGLPPSLKVDFLFDQSIFVRAAISGVVREGAIAGCLTGLMILLFLEGAEKLLVLKIFFYCIERAMLRCAPIESSEALMRGFQDKQTGMWSFVFD